MNVRRSINIHGEETQGKNQNAIRSFVLSGLARAVLEQQRAVTGTRESVFEISSELYYWKRWQAYCKANGIDRISVYELRHTFVSVVKTPEHGHPRPILPRSHRGRGKHRAGRQCCFPQAAGKRLICNTLFNTQLLPTFLYSAQNDTRFKIKIALARG